MTFFGVSRRTVSHVTLPPWHVDSRMLSASFLGTWRNEQIAEQRDPLSLRLSILSLAKVHCQLYDICWIVFGATALKSDMSIILNMTPWQSQVLMLGITTPRSLNPAPASSL